MSNAPDEGLVSTLVGVVVGLIVFALELTFWVIAGAIALAVFLVNLAFAIVFSSDDGP